MSKGNQAKARPIRVLLDSNVWSVLGRADQGAAFYQLMGDLDAEVVVAPSVLLEMSRSSNVDASRRERAAIFSGHRTQLPTEAELACASVVAEIRRLRPNWLLAQPDLREWKRLHRFWTVELWREARKDWARFTEVIGQVPIEGLDQILETQRRAKRDMIEQNLPLAPIRFQFKEESPAWLINAMPGPDLVVDAWRLEAMSGYWEAVTEAAQPRNSNGSARTDADWLECYVDVRSVATQRDDFARFWIADADPQRLKHVWLQRSATRYQLEAKVTGSSPFDAQHVAYLPECDLFLTGDRRLVLTIADLARDAPFAFAKAERLRRVDASIVDEIGECIVAAQRDVVAGTLGA